MRKPPTPTPEGDDLLSPDVVVVADTSDEASAFRLIEALAAEGYSALWTRNLPIGVARDDVLPRMIRRCLAVAVIVSHNTPRSDRGWLEREDLSRAIRAREDGGGVPVIVPLVLDGAKERVPYGLIRIKGASVVGAAFEPAAMVIAERLAALHRDDAVRAQRPFGDRWPEPGRVIAKRWRLVERIGHGGLASVWSAEDLQRRAKVAVKILHGHWRTDTRQKDRFRTGAIRMGESRHPSIVRVLDPPGWHDGWLLYAMELYGDGSLEEARLGPSTAEDGMFNVLQIARALDYMHRRGEVHGDVKPANILVDRRRRASLTDFDMVCSTDTTATSSRVCTFLYAAPETLRAEGRIGPAADIYSLAATAVFVLCGRPLDDSIMRSPRRFLRAAGIHPALRSVLLKALAENPDARPASVRTFADDMQAAWLRHGLWINTRLGYLPAGAAAMVGLSLVMVAGWSTGRADRPDDLWRLDPGVVHIAGDPPSKAVFGHALLVQLHEVTREQWVALTGQPAPSDGGPDCDRCPVSGVTWYEAATVANARSRAEGLDACYVLDRCTGRFGAGCGPESGGRCIDGGYQCASVSWRTGCNGYRLPTELEWLRAARSHPDGGRSRARATSSPAEVVEPPSRPTWPLDMSGNVAEWGEWPAAAPSQTIDSVPPGQVPVLGGAYDDPPTDTVIRRSASPSHRDRRIGFRLIRAVEEDT